MAQLSGETTLGYLVTSGNAETTSLNAKQALTYAADPWKNSFQATAVNTGDELRTTAERYSLSNKLDYNFSEKNYAFGVVEYEKDLFGGVRERTSEAVGYGRHILTGPAHTWDAEVGAGARQTEANVTGEKNADAIGRFSTAYQWKITDTARFAENVKVESGESNTFSESVTELKLNIIGNLAAVLSYNLRHNSRVPFGTEKLDTTAGVTLSYSFGKE
jgi:putative salt-induced outer membrane protein